MNNINFWPMMINGIINVISVRDINNKAIKVTYAIDDVSMNDYNVDNNHTENTKKKSSSHVPCCSRIEEDPSATK